MAHAGEFRRETLRGAEGFFRAGQDAAGRWWLLDPAGRPFFCTAAHGVQSTPDTGGSTDPAMDPAARLRRWGFNAVGAGGDGAGRDDGLAFMAVVDFRRAGAVIVAPGARLPDVFDPDWPRLAAARAAEACPSLAAARDLLGWVTDDSPGWAQFTLAGRPSLLQVCLSLEPAFAAYHAAWEFALALHGGRLETLARAWGVPLANKEVVRERTRAEQGLGTRGYLRDDARWSREFARRYFTSTAAAIRAVDPNHLVFGCRFAGPVGAGVLAECVYPAVDVTLCDWTELPVHATGAPRGGAGPAAGPVLAGNVCWADEAIRAVPHSAGPGPAAMGGVRRLTTVERMLRRGRTALERMARHPAVAGYVWRQWLDEPGEQPPFARGLVHRNGVEAREHAELLADFNARADALRCAALDPIFL